MSEEELLQLSRESMGELDTESLSDMLEEDSRRYSRRLTEEEEARLL